MPDFIPQSLALAAGIAISPIPIIAAILIILSGKSRRSSFGFLAGWAIGIIFAVFIFTFVVGGVPKAERRVFEIVLLVLQILLGLLLLFMAWKSWRGRPTGPGDAPKPKWMGSLREISAPKATGLAFLLAAANPMNLLVIASAGVLFRTSTRPIELIIAIGIFVLAAVSTVIIPVVSYHAAPAHLERPLLKAHDWLVKYNAVIVAVMCLIIGLDLLVKGAIHALTL